MAQHKSNPLPVLTALLLAAVVLPLFLNSQSDKSETLVVYCAHDSIFADAIIRNFEQRTGIRVQVRYDEEANKSLGLTNLLIAEKNQPRCDVFWNNQTLGTIRLKNEGVLQPCDPKLFARIPQQFRDSDNHWAGFAARLRVYIVNTDLMPATDDAIQKALTSDSLSQAAIAVPLFGTTLSHYAVLCDEMDLEELKGGTAQCVIEASGKLAETAPSKIWSQKEPANSGSQTRMMSSWPSTRASPSGCFPCD
jgi:iron(III) transport system substrate-binding protein